MAATTRRGGQEHRDRAQDGEPQGLARFAPRCAGVGPDLGRVRAAVRLPFSCPPSPPLNLTRPALSFLFVTSPTAEETLALLKGCVFARDFQCRGRVNDKGREHRFHDLIPYAALKLGLMLVNPTL